MTQFFRGLVENERNEVTSLVEGIRLVAYGGAGRTVTYYVRPGGNDSNSGLGPLPSQAFATFERAVESVPLYTHEEKYVIDISGMGVISLPGGLTLPPWNSIDDSNTLNLTPSFNGFFFDAPVNIRAQPTIVDTITAGEISSQTADAVTGQRTVNTTKSYALNAQRDLFLVGSVLGQIAPIVSNTAGPASSLETTFAANFTAPLSIVSLSAELRNSTAGSSAAAIRLRSSACPVNFQGVKFTHANASAGVPAVSWEGASRPIRFATCHVEGLNITAGETFAMLNTNAIVLITKNVLVAGAAIILGDASVRSARMDFRSSGPSQDGSFLQSCVFDTLVTMPQSSIPNFEASMVSMANTIIRNNSSHGLQVNRGTLWELTSVAIRGCAGFGINMDGGHAVLNTVRSTPGPTNTLGGLRVRSGGQAEVNAATDVNAGGAAELTVGDNAAITWAVFNGGAPPRNETDATVQLARCYRFT